MVYVGEYVNGERCKFYTKGLYKTDLSLIIEKTNEKMVSGEVMQKSDKSKREK